jgi:hypothetical protein
MPRQIHSPKFSGQETLTVGEAEPAPFGWDEDRLVFDRSIRTRRECP